MALVLVLRSWLVGAVGVHSKEAAGAGAAVVAVSGCYWFSPISACLRRRCDVEGTRVQVVVSTRWVWSGVDRV